MTNIARSQQVFSRIEFFLKEAKYEYAEALLFELLNQNPSDRESKLCLLLVNATRDGAVLYEEDINQLRNLYDLNDTEREIVRRLFVLRFESAEKEGREDQAWTYQRLLRRLILNQPFDQRIPASIAREEPTSQLSVPAPIINPLIPVHDHNPARLSDRVIALDRLIALLKEMGLVALSFIHRASQTAWKPTAHPRAALAIAAAGLLMIPVVYFWLPRAHTAGEASIYTNTALSRPKLANSVLTVDPISRPQHRDDAESTKRERVHHMVANQLPSLQRAYGKWIRKNRNLMGSLLVKMEVDAAGNVVKAEDVASRLTDSEFREVVLAEARKWKFRNANVDAAEFTVPLLFVPKDMDPETIVRWERTLNSSDAEAKNILPVHITTPSADEKDKLTIKPNQSPAGLKAPKTVVADGSKTKKPEGPSEHGIDYKTRRAVPLRQEPRFAAATTQDIDPGATIAVL